MDRSGKESLRKVAAERFSKSKAVIVAEYRGLTVEELTKLRVELRKASAEFKIVKNRIAKKAISIEQNSFENVSSGFRGPVGVVFAYGDSAAATKVALEFAKTHDKFVVTTGQLGGEAYNKSQLQVIADLPPKEVLIARILGTMVAPHKGIMGVMNGVTRNLVQVINAIKDKKTA